MTSDVSITRVAVRKGGLRCSHAVLLKTCRTVSGIWCSWLSHPLSMALSAGGLRFESGFVHSFCSSSNARMHDVTTVSPIQNQKTHFN